MSSARAGSGPAVAMAAAAAVVLAGCAGPEYTYVRSGQAYFKVPAEWRKVDQKALDRALFGDPDSPRAQALKSLIWAEAYDAGPIPSIDHLGAAAGPVNDPIALAMVRTLTAEQRQEASLNAMRNVFFPLTGERAGQAGHIEILKDEELPQPGGAKGVRTVFNLTVAPGRTQTLNQTVYLSGDGGTMSTLLIQCSAACYQERARQIDLVAQSFRIKPDTS